MWYSWLEFLHVLASFAFVFAHGASAVVALRLPRERALDRIRALLELAEATRPGAQLSLGIILITGIALGLLGGWWRMAWFWISLVLLAVVTFSMDRAADRIYAPLKRAVGLAYLEGSRIHPPQDPLRPDEIAATLREVRPLPLFFAGYGSMVVMIALMVLKPF